MNTDKYPQAIRAYQVGGCVRDRLLNREPHDIDYVVVGHSPACMLALGFHQVGTGFPVFLHPQTREEYALARGESHETDNGLDWNWANVTLEDDLARRDLTINAMAMDESGRLIDPYGGQADLHTGVLRHVGDSFAEDPLRVLRVARFAAQLGFSVAPKTLALMKAMACSGQLDNLTPERIGAETNKALLTSRPSRYFEVLDEVGALAIVFPELKALDGIPQRPDYHAEGDVWVHTRMVLDEAASASQDLPHDRRLRITTAALCHDLGKASTPAELLWGENGEIVGKHHGHEDPERFGPALSSLAKRLRMPTSIRRFCHLIAEHHQRIHTIRSLSARKLIQLYDALGLDRHLRHDDHYLEDIVTACAADNSGRLHRGIKGVAIKPPPYHQGTYLMKAMHAIASVDQGSIIREYLASGHSVDYAKQRTHQARMAMAKGFIAGENLTINTFER